MIEEKLFLERNKNLIEKLKAVVKELEKSAKTPLSKIFERHHYKKGTVLFNAGEKIPQLFFVESGLVRTYIPVNAKKKITDNFFAGNEILDTYAYSVLCKPSKISGEIMTDSTLWLIRCSTIFRLENEHPAITQIERLLICLLSEKFRKISLEQRFFSVEERFNFFLKRYSEYIHCIPNVAIAQYLGITQETLSRLTNEKKAKEARKRRKLKLLE